MNAKRKTRQEQTTGDDELMQEQNEQQPDAPDEPAQPQADAGTVDVQQFDPAQPQLRPGQAHEHPHQDRDDDRDRDYRAAQGGTFAGEAINASGELQGTVQSDEKKPAEPRPGVDPYSEDDDRRPNAYPVAKPGVETVESGRIPGAGDPQNGVKNATGKSPIAWADTSKDVAQHYALAEDEDAPTNNVPLAAVLERDTTAPVPGPQQFATDSIVAQQSVATRLPPGQMPDEPATDNSENTDPPTGDEPNRV